MVYAEKRTEAGDGGNVAFFICENGGRKDGGNMIYKREKDGGNVDWKTGKRKRERPLTARQKAFARARADGKTLRESYTQAGYSDGGNDHTLRNNAFQLERKDKVRTEIERLQKQVEAGNILSREQRLAMLSELASDADGCTGKKDRLRALDMLAKMHGDYTETVVNRIDGAIEIDRKQAFNDYIEDLTE